MIENEQTQKRADDSCRDDAFPVLHFPASSTERRLWFLEQLEPGTSFYHTSFLLRIQGTCNVAYMQQSLAFLCARHEILRTTFSMDEEGQLLQYIAPTATIPLPLLDVSAVQADQREETARQLAHAEAHRPFDLQQGPLLRTLLIRLLPEEHFFALTLHHIITDSWSEALLIQELAAGYTAAAQGKRLALPPLPLQYADYSVWQQKRMQSPSFQKHLAYWKEQLAGAPTILDLPTDFARPAIQRQQKASLNRSVPAELLRQVRMVSQQEGVTLFMTLLSAFALLLNNMSGQQDILLGTTVTGRIRRELEGLIGFFANTLPMRIYVQEGINGRQFLQSVREVTIEAYVHQETPFEQIVEQMHPARDLSRSPLIQVLFTLDNIPGQLPTFGEATLALVEESAQTGGNFDLDLYAIETGEELLLVLEYDTDLFSAISMQNLLERYQVLLGDLIRNLSQPLAQVAWLSEAERQRVIREWNATDTHYPRAATLRDLFAQQVQMRPDAIAVLSEQVQLSYAELDHLSNQLTQYLLEHGVGPDIPVGICIERSPDLLVAILGVVKSGGAYLPLDSDTPPLRLAQLLDNADATLCLFQNRQDMPVLPSHIHTITPQDWQSLSYSPHALSQVQIHPEHLVSIYYTSGSTGQPKGVANTHTGWVNRMLWMQQKYQLRSGETVLQKTTITFDDSAVEVFWPLIVGGRIALLEADLHKDPAAILDAAIYYQVGILQFVPAMLLLFLELITPEARARLHTLRYVISSGEALRMELVRLFMERLSCTLHNQWGPTEVSIDATEHTCHSADILEKGIIAIGRPIANTQVYILDKHLQPVSSGTIGDLYLAGVGLARGYINDPIRTAEAFLPNPFTAGTLMYKTGDRGYYRSDGSLIFLGRVDEQIKVRGQRVELGEIEATLAASPDVQNGVVVAHKRADGYRLTGYVVLYHSQDETQQMNWQKIQTIRSFLQERLPAYMLPGRIVPIEHLPLMPNGKIDRKLLPDLGDERPELQHEYVAPTTATERAITDIWQEVLGLTHIGSQDRFFDLGGHSLDATRVISHTNQRLQVHIPLKALFEEPTIAGLARRVDQALTEHQKEQQKAIVHLPLQESYEASHAQVRQWLVYQLEPEHAYGALLALEFEGKVKQEFLIQALSGVMERHTMLRTTFIEQAEQLRQLVHDGVILPYHSKDLSHLSSSEQREQLAWHVAQFKDIPFNLKKGPLFRVGLYTLASHRHRLVLSIHPIAFDSWSLGILMKDLSVLYCLSKEGRAHTEYPQPLHYTDYAFWQNQRLAGNELDTQKRYWHEQLKDSIPMARLPGNRTTPVPQAPASPYRLFRIGHELAEKLYTLSAAHDATLFMTLLAGLKIWLATLLRRTDIAVGSALSGRINAELEDIFGIFWNPVILRTNLSGNPSYLQILERVQRTVLGAFANQEYPFDQILEDQHYNTSLYSVMFILQNASTSSLTFDDVTMKVSLSERLEANSESFGDELAARYDLHIEAFELDGSIILAAQYNSRRFLAETVDGWLAQFISVLEQVTSYPEKHLSQLMLFTSSEMDELFAEE